MNGKGCCQKNGAGKLPDREIILIFGVNLRKITIGLSEVHLLDGSRIRHKCFRWIKAIL